MPASTIRGVVVGMMWCGSMLGQTTQPAAQPEMQAATQPATQPSPPQVQAARRAVADAVAAVVQDLGSDVLARRQAAQKTLTALSEMVLSEVLSQARLNDPEQAARAAELFETLVSSARQGQMLLQMSHHERADVLALAPKAPKAFNKLFSGSDSAAAEAVTELASREKPGVESILVWACRQDGWETRLAGLEAAQNLAKPYARLCDLLVRRLPPIASASEEDSDVTTPRETVRFAQEQAEHVALYRALAAMKDSRILGRLLRMYVRNPAEGGAFDDPAELMGLILQLNDKRTVATLMGRINDKEMASEFSVDNKTIKMTRGDAAMILILLQTRQKPADYGFRGAGEPGEGPATQAGFEADQQRSAARKKLTEWWDKNQADYQGVPKIPLHLGKEGDDAGRDDLPEFIRHLKDE